jgi:hypothetical protein
MGLLFQRTKQPQFQMSHSRWEDTVGWIIAKIRITIFKESFERMEMLAEGFK